MRSGGLGLRRCDARERGMVSACQCVRMRREICKHAPNQKKPVGSAQVQNLRI